MRQKHIFFWEFRRNYWGTSRLDKGKLMNGKASSVGCVTRQLWIYDENVVSNHISDSMRTSRIMIQHFDYWAMVATYLTHYKTKGIKETLFYRLGSYDMSHYALFRYTLYSLSCKFYLKIALIIQFYLIEPCVSCFQQYPHCYGNARFPLG